MRTLLLTIHIIGAGVWIGANAVQIATTPQLIARGGQAAATWMDTVVRWGRVIYTPAAIISLVTGIALVLDSDFYDFSNAFVSIGFVAIVAGAVIGIGPISKGSARASVAFAAGDDTAGRAEVSKTIPWSLVDTLVIVVTVVAMVAKWGA